MPTLRNLTDGIRALFQRNCRNAEIDANKITLEVQGSKAILKGSVRAWAEREEAERVAWSAPGITSVENRITFEV